VKPGIQGAQAVCWLKEQASAPKAKDGRTSGLVREDGLELNVDRRGSDYSDFWMNVPDPLVCKTACVNDTACRAFTFVQEGIQGAQARCYLKNAVPVAKPYEGGSSGVVR
jgi:hypothetical protein